MESGLELSYRKRGLYYFVGYSTNNCDDKYYGEVFVLDSDNKITGKGFVVDSLLFGVVNRYKDGENIYSEFYSLYEPGIKISEGEYRKELANIRFGIKEIPDCFKWYSKTLPDNWFELISKKIKEDNEKSRITFKFSKK